MEYSYRGTTYVECPLNFDDLDGSDDLRDACRMLLGDDLPNEAGSCK